MNNYYYYTHRIYNIYIRKFSISLLVYSYLLPIKIEYLLFNIDYFGNSINII